MPAEPAPPAAPPVVRTPRKAKGQGAERREEILAHAMRLFAEHGVHDVSTRRLAEAVGVSQPTLYAYFPTKDALLEEVCAVAFEELGRRMRAIPRGGSTLDRLCALGQAYIRFGLERPDAYRIAFMLEPATGKPVAHDEAVGHGAFSILQDAVREHLGADHPQAEAMAQSVWAAHHGLVALLLARPGFPWVERDALVTFHTRAVQGMVSAAE